jgi:hypothetical protein
MLLVYYIILNSWVTIDRVIGFTDHSQNLTTVMTVSLIRTLYSSLEHTLSLLSLLCLHRSSGNSFHQRTFPLLCIPELSPCLSYQLIATAHNRSHRNCPVTDSLTQLTTHFSPLTDSQTGGRLTLTSDSSHCCFKAPFQRQLALA